MASPPLTCQQANGGMGNRPPSPLTGEVTMGGRRLSQRVVSPVMSGVGNKPYALAPLATGAGARGNVIDLADGTEAMSMDVAHDMNAFVQRY
ncbi:hypothetical protein HK101_012015 [Irineochytrium annulatum]|nr:hypothetical protein HK101_012015 [Irineochytrium annulatum]